MADNSPRTTISTRWKVIVAFGLFLSGGIILAANLFLSKDKSAQRASVAQEQQTTGLTSKRSSQELSRFDTTSEHSQNITVEQQKKLKMKKSQNSKPNQPSLAEKLAFFPSKYPEGNWQPARLRFEDCWFNASDGVRLHGWYCSHEKPRSVLLFAHGNAGNLSHRADVIRLLNEQFASSVLIFDYRGYGRSEGTPTIDGVLLDVRAARNFLIHEKKVPADEIVLMGRSIGGAIMVDLAAETGARGLILESTFTSLREAAISHYPKMLVRLAVPDQLNSISRIGEYEGPLLISHGDADRVIPYSQGQRLFEAANQPKQFITIPGGDHNDSQSREYFESLDRFIGSLPSTLRK